MTTLLSKLVIDITALPGPEQPPIYVIWEIPIYACVSKLPHRFVIVPEGARIERPTAQGRAPREGRSRTPNIRPSRNRSLAPEPGDPGPETELSPRQVVARHP